MLIECGFADVRVVEKKESREFIKDWLPGSGAEDYVVSANVTANKPEGAFRVSSPEKTDAKIQSIDSLAVSVSEALADASGVDQKTATGVGAAVADLTVALGAVLRALGEHHAQHTDEVTDGDAKKFREPEPVVEENAGC
jgi:hypothetical protein